MSVGLLLVTHNGIGDELLKTAHTTIGGEPMPTRSVAVTTAHDPDLAAAACDALLRELDSGEGVLVLTDAYGCTPSNIVTRHSGARVAVVSGLNLPMLLRVMNYPSLSLEELQQKAVSGGQDGVVLVLPDGEQ